MISAGLACGIGRSDRTASDGTVAAEFDIRRRVDEPISAERKSEACAEMTEDGATADR